MIRIPAGDFLMGSAENDPDAYSDEKPQHKVSVPSFQMAETPVTIGQWNRACELPPVDTSVKMKPKDGPSDHVAVNVTWYQAQEFCARVSAKTGRTITLPSEAQWEYACRAGTTGKYNFGDGDPESHMVCNGSSERRVKTKPASQFGLYDMHGLAWEWTLDTYIPGYEGAPDDGSAWVAEADVETLTF